MWVDVVATPVLAAALVSLARADLATRRLPDPLTLPLIMAGLALGAWRIKGLPVAELGGAIAGGLLFWGIGAAIYRARGVDALGLGDAKLFAAAGAWLGWRALPAVLLIASLGALLAHFAARAAGRCPARTIAFGPWLAAAFFAVWCADLAR